jgi:hypothetical protein
MLIGGEIVLEQPNGEGGIDDTVIMEPVQPVGREWFCPTHVAHKHHKKDKFYAVRPPYESTTGPITIASKPTKKKSAIVAKPKRPIGSVEIPVPVARNKRKLPLSQVY